MRSARILRAARRTDAPRSQGSLRKPHVTWLPAKVHRAALRVPILLALLLGIVAASAVSASAEPLCTNTWIGGAEGNWQEAANWSAGHAPTSTDVACIGTGKKVSAWGEANHAGVLEVAGTLQITGTSLEVSNTLEPSTVAHLETSGGVLTGAANVNVTESFQGNGGTIAMTGVVSIASAATGTISSFTTLNSTLANAGTFTVAGSAGLQGTSTASFLNSGTLTVNAEGVKSGLFAEGSTRPILLNTGTVQKTSGTGLTEIDFAINNESTVRRTSGTLLLNGGGPGTVSGTWISEGTGRVWFWGLPLSLGPSPTLSGSFEVSGAVTAGVLKGASPAFTVNPSASLSVSGPETSVLKTLTMHGGVFATNAEADLTERLFVEGNGELSGSGAVVISSGAVGEVLEGSQMFLRGLLVNHGTLIEPINSGIEGYGGAELVNDATLTLNGENYAPFGAHTGLARVSSSETPRPRLVNYGLIQKTEGAGTVTVQFAFENFGTLEAKTGKFELEAVITSPGSQDYGGADNPSAPGQPHPTCGDPVTCATGNLSEAQTDFSIGGRGVGLDLTRTYNSQAAAAGTSGPFGHGWSSSFSDRLALEPGEKRATLYQSNGSTVPFTESGASFIAPAWTQDTLSGSAEAGYTLTLADQIKYHFAGASGRLETVTDRNGNVTTLSYGVGGRLESITDPASRKITLAYNGEGLIESAKDPMGHVVAYSYEGGDLASVIEPGETEPRWRFKYDGSHQLTELTDGRGGKTINEYNAAHQVISQTDPLKQLLTFEYEPFETKITNHATGSVTDEHFTSSYLPVSITRGFGTANASTESFSYDGAGNVLSTTDGNGHTTKYTYDAASNRTSTLDPDKNESKWTYDATHDVETTTTPNGETTTIERDTHGNAIKVSRPAPGAKTQSTKYKYATHGELESVTDPLERTTKYEYDSYGDRKSEIDPEADKRTWAYNEDSQVTSTVSPRGVAAGGTKEAKYKTTIERDAQGRPTLVIAPLKHETKYSYDGNGNLESVTDPELNKTTYTYDADNEAVKVEQPNGTITETGYDGSGRVTSQTDGNKHTTTYVRNLLGEVTEVIDPLGRKTLKEYDAAGNLTKLTDAAKRTTKYTYDPADRLTEVDYSSEATSDVKYEYDSDGNRTRMVDGTGTSKYVYDQLDRLTESKDGHGDVVGYEYDLANEQTKITYPSGKAVTRAYDNAGRLKSVTDWLEHASKFAYDADSNQTATTFPAGTGNEDTYTYNEADAMSEVKMAKGAETLASLEYARNKDGGVTKATTVGLPGEEKPAFTYDNNSRLTKGAGIAYKYDAADNTTKIGTGAYTYDAASQLEKGPSLTYTYDELGERTKTKPTSGPATTYGYDQANDLIAVARPKEGEAPAIEDSYAYDGDGVRTSQTISGATSQLSWDTTEELPTLIDDGSSSYIYGPARLPVEQITAGGETTYLHRDQQGSTRLVTTSTGAVAGTTTYDAYGNTLGIAGAPNTPMGYDGQYTSSDSGLIDLRTRTYDPGTGHFLTPDPLAALTRAPYGYADDNPVNKVDPAGLCSINPFSSSSCLTEGVEAGVHFAQEHPVATGIVLGVVAVGTGGAALAVEGGVASGALATGSAVAGAGATALDGSRCLNGDNAACVGAGLGVASLAAAAPEYLAERGLVSETSVFRGLAGASVVFGAYGTLADFLAGDTAFLTPLFGC